MKRVSFYSIALLFAGIIAALSVSCRQEETAAPLASLALNVDGATAESITFTVTPDANTACFHYTCVPTSDTASASYTKVTDQAPLTVTVDSLIPDTEYTVMAFAENIDGLAGSKVKATAVTTSAPQVSITVIESASTTVRFTISALNADSYSYGVLRSSEAADGELPGLSENGTEQEFVVDTLAPLTSYAVAAEAVNSAGETSERVLSAFRTDLLPVVCVGEVTSDLTSAVVPLSWKDCNTVYYALTETGSTPAEYKTIEPGTDTATVLSFYELTGNAGYTFTAYGVTEKGNSGDTVTVEFVTEDVESDHKVTVSDISSYDAKFTATWDTEKYSGCRWYADLSANISDPSAFDWEEAISSYKARYAYNNSPVSLSSFSPVSSEKYMAGFIFMDIDGNPVMESVIWKEVQLDQITFGDSDCTAEMEEISISFSKLRYRVKSNGAAQYYFGVTPRQFAEDIEAYALTVLKSTPSTSFDEILEQNNLLPETDYTAVVLPVDAEGRFGAIESMEFTTEARAFNGSGELEVTFKEATWTSAVFDVQLGENTIYVVRNSSLSPIESEEEILRTLASVQGQSGASIYESGEFKDSKTLTTYSDNTLYSYFAAVDETGRFSDLKSFETPLKDIVFDGTGTVDVRMDKVTPNGKVFDIEYTLTPDSNVDYYYYRITSYFTNAALSDEQIAVQFLTMTYYEAQTGELSTYSPKGNEPSVGTDTYIILMPVDKDGRLCKPIRYLIEETSAQ